jgi:uncharacterized membrane protein YeaQ/YmgE (transglycosylase-associated protein family)
MHILWIIIIGFVAGIIARFLAPGPNNPAGFILTTLLGIAGAFVATLIGQTIGWYSPNQGAGLLGAVVGAVVVLFIWHRLVTNRSIPDPGRRWLLAGAGRVLGLTAARSALQHGMARRAALDHDSAGGAGAPAMPGGDRYPVYVLALAHAQHGRSCLLERHFHQRGHDFDPLPELFGEPLRRGYRLLDGRRIASHAPPAVLCLPYVAHVRTFIAMVGAFADCAPRRPSEQPIIGPLPHCSKALCAALTRNSQGKLPAERHDLS